MNFVKEILSAISVMYLMIYWHLMFYLIVFLLGLSNEVEEYIFDSILFFIEMLITLCCLKSFKINDYKRKTIFLFNTIIFIPTFLLCLLTIYMVLFEKPYIAYITGDEYEKATKIASYALFAIFIFQIPKVYYILKNISSLYKIDLH